jgi:hypothetical protein
MHAYHYRNTKHVSIPLATANINAYFHDTGVFRDISQWKPESSLLLLFPFNAIGRQRAGCIYTGTIKQYLYKCFYLYLNTFKTNLMILTFLNFNY